ncbi:MAG TPA: DUF4012 domain-containing protein [Patescibacteria group bacterium]|nr:DUF4012 domain-containing protein [Patescibacteria group bacterium]
MDTPLVVEEKKQGKVILIIDKQGTIGKEIAHELVNQTTTVLVSEQKPLDETTVFVPFVKAVPEVPEGKYSHIFLISSEQKHHELTPSLIEKANNDDARFIYVLSYRDYKEEMLKQLEECSNYVLVLLGEIFGNREFPSLISDLFSQAKEGKVSLPELGLETVRPALFEDVIESIIRIGMGGQKKILTFAFSKHPMTCLSVVHGLQKENPDIKIDFPQSSKTTSILSLPEGTYLLDSTYPVGEKLREAYKKWKEHIPRFSSQNNDVLSLAPIKKRKKEVKKPILLVVSTGVLLLLLPWIWLGMSFLTAGVMAEPLKKAVLSGNFQQGKTYAQAMTALLGAGQWSKPIAEWEASVIGQEGSVSVLFSQINTSEQLATIVAISCNGLSHLQTVMKGNPQNPLNEFTSGINDIKSGLLLEQQLNVALLPGSLQPTVKKLQPLLTLAEETIDISPQLFGFTKQMTYLVLLENNNELRPGGGFIGSYAVVSVKNGKITSFTVHNVYDADGQLKGHVEPPFAIRRYIPLVHWYLRDSNFSADFIKDAQNAAFFLKAETGEEADGVVGVDLSVIKTLLASSGPVYLPTYNQTITPDNFFLLTEQHAEKNNFAGSTQKQDFLNALSQELQKKLFAGNFSAQSLLENIYPLFSQKHLLVAFADGGLQQIFTVNSLSSSLTDLRPTEAGQYNDFAAISEANIGINKVNFFVKRNVLQDMSISPTGSVSGTLNIIYTNTSDGTWPGGDYKNYLRVFLPQGAQLSAISLNGVLQSRYPAVIDPKVYEATNFKAPKGLEIEQTTEGGRVGYGFLVIIPKTATTTVSISYVLTQKIQLSGKLVSYNALLFKQPGTDAYPYTFTLEYPSALKLFTSPSGTIIETNKATLKESLDTDKNYQFVFTNQ